MPCVCIHNQTAAQNADSGNKRAQYRYNIYVLSLGENVVLQKHLSSLYSGIFDCFAE